TRLRSETPKPRMLSSTPGSPNMKLKSAMPKRRPPSSTPGSPNMKLKSAMLKRKTPSSTLASPNTKPRNAMPRLERSSIPVLRNTRLSKKNSRHSLKNEQTLYGRRSCWLHIFQKRNKA
ncbi:hypothetical protein BKA66DRAFT_456152, partial [Pyrenochaeta sp. MPI-SDFR-AT-0127]